MAKQKRSKRSDGRYSKSFTVNGQRYFVYGYTVQELEEKERKKRQELEKRQVQRVDPTLNQYYERFTENRKQKVKSGTIIVERSEFKKMRCR